MGFFSGVTSFLSRHKRKVIYLGTAAVAIYAGKSWLANKVSELHDKAGAEKTKKEGTLLKFRQNQQDATFTVLSLLPSIADLLFTELNVEAVTDELKQVQSSAETSGGLSREEVRREKLRLWEKVKMMTLTRTLSAIYIMSFLIVLVRIKINLLGMLQTQRKGEKESESSFLVERRFLTFTWWLIHRGAKEIVKRVESAVETVLQSVPIQQRVTLTDLDALIHRIRGTLDAQQQPSWNYEHLLLPSEAFEKEIPTQQTHPLDKTSRQELKNLLQSTREWLRHPDVPLLVNELIDVNFEKLSEQLNAVFLSSPVSSMQTKSPIEGTVTPASSIPTEKEEPAVLTVPLVGLLPTITKQAHAILEQLPNNYVENLDDVKSLDAFSAMIYTNVGQH